MPVRDSRSTSSRTSTSSCTSERPVGLVRLTHPFPSLLNGAATVALGLAAGGQVLDAGRLGLAMIALQVSIGALNDIRDREADRVAKPAKPIPAGLVSTGEAGALAVAGFLAGLALSAPSGLPTLTVAVIGVGCGYAYDLGLKSTALSWLPLAVALPLVPMFAWLGVGANVPAAFALLLPLAILAGAGLALANALEDVDNDRASGLATIVGRVGAPAAWRAHLLLQGVVVAVAIGTLLWLGGRGPGLAAAVGAGIVILAVAWAGWRGGGALRPHTWEVEAAGVAALGTAWVGALAGIVR